MCGRFSLAVDPTELLKLFPGLELPGEYHPRYNIAPTQAVLGIREDREHQHRLEAFHWGLVPSWAQDAKIGSSLINARADSLAAKPAFRAAFRRRRCLILADGFYEWRKGPGGTGKTPVWIHPRAGGLIAFAGLYDWWRPADAGEEVPLMPSCTIVTTDACDELRPVHDRMPVVLTPEAYARWLDPDEQDPGRLQPLLRPAEAGALVMHPVSKAVNSARVDAPELIRPVAEQLDL